MDVDRLRRTVLDLVEVDPESIEDDADLFVLGLDSIVLMQLVGRWRQSGIDINFAELAENPTIGAWVKLLSTRELAAAVATSVDTGPDNNGEFPLAIMQHAYWIGRVEGQQLGGVAAHLYTEFDGSCVDADRLRSAIERLITRHDILRVRFTEDGQQRIEATSGWRGLTVHDLRDFDHDQITARLNLIRETLSHQMLDIENGEVFYTALSLLPGGYTRLHLDVDMIAADARSYRIMLADLAQFYEQPDTPFPGVDYTYREYRTTRLKERQQAASRAAEWWQKRLSNLPGAPELPLVAKTNEGEHAGPIRVTRRHFTLPPEQRKTLIEVCRQRGLTPAMVMATVFAEVLGAWSTQPRFLLNVPLFDREPLHHDVNKLVGDFSSSVLLEVDLTNPVKFVERVRQIQSRMHTDAAYAAYTGVEVLRDLTRLNGQQVLATVVFTSALSLGELFDPVVRRCFGDPVWITSQGPQVLLDTQIIEMNSGLLVNWDVREQEFPEGVIDAMFMAFERLVHRLIQNGPAWDTPVDDLLPPQQRMIRTEVNNTAWPLSNRLLHEGFFEHAEKDPERIAVIWGDAERLSYGELAERARRVAGLLIRYGVMSGDVVAITLPKGVDQVVAVLGVLASGAAYVPVGIDQPPVRRARIYESAGVRVVLTNSDTHEAHGLSNITAIDISTAVDSATVKPMLGISGESAAYVIYTSGSTGEPKGVEVPHRAVINTIEAVKSFFSIGKDDRSLALSSLDFDLSAYDLFAFLSYGGSVILIEESARRDAWYWAKLIRQWNVTVLSCVPTFLDMLLTVGANSETGTHEGLGTSLRVVMLGGDWVGTDLPGRLWKQIPDCRFAGLGGMTEAAIHSTLCEVTGPPPPHWRAVPYGRPLRNMRCRVVDAQGRDRPDWVPGELWVGGPGVALGYRGDPERTAAKFVNHDGLRWYRSGDLSRYWPDGTLEFLGRADHQVKIRGYRIELGEIEAALRAHEKVSHAVAVVIGEQTRHLAAAVTLANPFSSVDPEDLCRWTADQLPSHMVPKRVIVLDTLPITRIGKLDRREIHRLLATGPAVQPVFQPAQGALEEAVAQIWSELLQVPQVGRTESFFALGGDSLLATRVISQLSAASINETMLEMQRKPTVADLYRYPTVASLAKYLGAATENSSELDRVAARARLQRRARQGRAAGLPRKNIDHIV